MSSLSQTRSEVGVSFKHVYTQNQEEEHQKPPVWESSMLDAQRHTPTETQCLVSMRVAKTLYIPQQLPRLLHVWAAAKRVGEDCTEME